MPLALSPEPGFETKVKIGDRDGFDCRIYSVSRGTYWLHAGLTDSPQIERRAAEEALWPLRVGNRSHAHFDWGGHTYAVEYQVASFEKLTARAGTYDTFRVNDSLTEDGKLVYTINSWWAPSLRYTLSYRLYRYVAGDNNVFWEIAAINARDS
jgi:hypothetical protein